MVSFLKKNKDMMALFLCVLLHTIVLYIICDFRKALATYGDELLYYDIARSIFNGQGLQVHGISFQFRNLAYCYYLVPFFCISNSVLRMHAITLANSFLMSLCVIPEWLICKQLCLRKRDRWFVVILMMIWPDMLTAGTMMSENLYWILSLTAMYFCIKSILIHKKLSTVMSAFFCYLAYFCKETAICIFLAYVAFGILYPCIEGVLLSVDVKGDMHKYWKRVKYSYRKFLSDRVWINLIIFVSVFAGCYLLFQKVLLKDVGNYYSFVDFSSMYSRYGVMYFFYGILYYMVASVVAFMVYPVLYPALHYKKSSRDLCKVYLFAVILLVGMLLMIDLSITVREDLGRIVPRVHLRYIASLIGLFLPALFRTIVDVQNDKDYMLKSKKNAFWLWSVFWIICAFFYKGVLGGCANENAGLAFSQFLAMQMNNESVGENGTVIFYVSAAVICIIIGGFLIVWNYFSYAERNKKYFPTVLFLSFIILSLVNLTTGTMYLHDSYKADESAVVEMSLINNYFKEHELEKKRVMLICKDGRTDHARIYDTYFDGINNLEFSYETFMSRIWEKGEKDISISELDFNENIWGIPYHTDAIDYFILCDYPAALDSVIDGLEQVHEISRENYAVYKNVNASNIMCTQAVLTEDLLIDIDFTEEKYNAPLFVWSGISHCEGGFSWTDGNEVQVRAFAPDTTNTVNVKFDLERIYNEKQEIVIYQGENVIFQDKISEKTEFSFLLTPINGDCSFKIYFPDAVSPCDLGESLDIRKLAVSLKRITFTENK